MPKINSFLCINIENKKKNPNFHENSKIESKADVTIKKPLNDIFVIRPSVLSPTPGVF